MAVIDHLFNESWYLRSYPDVAAAVQAGQLPSGRAHFFGAGLQEGRTQISIFYDVREADSLYLEANPDVAEAVASGIFASGLHHYVNSGEQEGRALFPDGFDEDWYRNRYPDVAAAITQGEFTSGLEHYLAFGRDEIRSVSSLFEFDYDTLYPRVRSIYLSAADHYAAAGQFEGRQVTFSGTSGNDTITGGATVDILTGVELDVDPLVSVLGTRRRYRSVGDGDQDVLIGGAGVDYFELGYRQTSLRLSFSVNYYQGEGDLDFARIVNFEPGRDRLVLSNPVGPPRSGCDSGIDLEATPEGLKIYSLNETTPSAFCPARAFSRDLMAIVEGISSPDEILGDITLASQVTFTTPLL